MRHGRCLLREAGTHNAPLFCSSLHKNLIYTLRSPSASALCGLYPRRGCFVASWQTGAIVQQGETTPCVQHRGPFLLSVSPSLVPLESPIFISTALRPPSTLRSVETVARRTTQPEENAIKGIHSPCCKAIIALILLLRDFFFCKRKISSFAISYTDGYYYYYYYWFLLCVKNTLNSISPWRLLLINHEHFPSSHLPQSLKCINTNRKALCYVKYIQKNNDSINIWLGHIHNSQFYVFRLHRSSSLLLHPVYLKTTQWFKSIDLQPPTKAAAQPVSASDGSISSTPAILLCICANEHGWK